MPRVLHLAGSPTDEFHAELSRVYAQDCLEATADLEGHEPLVAFVSPGGRWRFPEGLSHEQIESADEVGLPAALTELERAEVALPQMFCRAGMTAYRALLEVLGIPYVGNDPAAMALTADKDRARAVVSAAGVAVPEGEVVGPGERPSVAMPFVVKPAAADNSHGVSLVREPGRLDDALEAAFAHGDRVLCESYIELGREVRCGVIEIDGEPTCLPLEEYAVDAIRSSEDKLRRGEGGELSLVAKGSAQAWIVDRDDPIVDGVTRAALACHRALGCRDHGLFDFRMDCDGKPWFLEAGLYCSFARGSVICAMAQAQGLSPTDLLRAALAAASERAMREMA